MVIRKTQETTKGMLTKMVDAWCAEWCDTHMPCGMLILGDDSTVSGAGQCCPAPPAHQYMAGAADAQTARPPAALHTQCLHSMVHCVLSGEAHIPLWHAHP